MDRGKTSEKEWRDAEKRRAIINAAMELFAEKGLRRTTMDEIAARVGITKGTIYWYFKNKEDLFYAAVDQGLADMRRDFTQVLKVGGDPRKMLEDITTTLISSFAISPESCRIFFTLWTEKENSFQRSMEAEVREMYEQYTAMIQQIVQRGIDEGQLKPGNAKEMASILIAMVTGLMFLWLISGGAFSPHEMVPALLTCYFSGFGSTSPGE